MIAARRRKVVDTEHGEMPVRYPVDDASKAIPCKGPGCGCLIVFVKMATGRNMPVELDGTPHWANCTDSPGFRERSKLEERLREIRTKGW